MHRQLSQLGWMSQTTPSFPNDIHLDGDCNVIHESRQSVTRNFFCFFVMRNHHSRVFIFCRDVIRIVPRVIAFLCVDSLDASSHRKSRRRREARCTMATPRRSRSQPQARSHEPDSCYRCNPERGCHTAKATARLAALRGSPPRNWLHPNLRAETYQVDKAAPRGGACSDRGHLTPTRHPLCSLPLVAGG